MKCAVPKLDYIEVSTGHFAGQSGIFKAQIKTHHEYEEWHSASANDPALALFWAIEGIINEW